MRSTSAAIALLIGILPVSGCTLLTRVTGKECVEGRCPGNMVCDASTGTCVPPRHFGDHTPGDSGTDEPEPADPGPGDPRPGDPSCLSTWFDPAWRYRKAITIDGGRIGPGSHSDFPVLISITDMDLTSEARADGLDIYFAEPDGRVLNSQIEDWNPSTARLVAWVRVPLLVQGTDLTFFVYYGNANAPGPPPSEVWSPHHVGVWHLNEQPSPGGVAFDSTDNAINHAMESGMTVDDQVQGKVGHALHFDGNDGDVLVADDHSALGGMAELAVETWIRLDSLPSPGPWAVSYKRNNSSPWYSWQLLIVTWDGPPRAFFEVSTQTNDDTHTRTATFLESNTWYHIAAVYESGQRPRIHLNGEDDSFGSSGTITGNIMDSNWHHQISWTNEFQGIIDEVRVSSIARTPGWILTSYNNQQWPNKQEDGSPGFIRLSIPEDSCD
ncbi:DUF2341 domain-containing protein [Myxococcota bacterium]